MKFTCTATVIASKAKEGYTDRKTGQWMESKSQNVVVLDPVLVETDTFEAPLFGDDGGPVTFEAGKAYEFLVSHRCFARFSGPVIVTTIEDAKLVGAASAIPAAPTATKTPAAPSSTP
jgi:hypothetical protein